MKIRHPIANQQRITNGDHVPQAPAVHVQHPKQAAVNQKQVLDSDAEHEPVAESSKQAPIETDLLSSGTQKVLNDLQNLREELEELMRLNKALQFLDTRLEQIEDWITEARPDDSDKILKELEKFIDSLQKEMSKVVKEVQKILREYEEWLESLNDDQLLKLFQFLNFLIKNDVSIDEEGIWIDGDLVIEIDDDLVGVCCQFG